MDTIESSLEKIHINITYSNILPLIIYICRDEGPDIGIGLWAALENVK